MRIECDGAPIPTKRKQSRKPLDMLHLLAIAGERGMPVAHICMALWPDSDGDAARKSFDNTLHRLRKLLGGERHVLLHSGNLSLNHGTCWTDLAALNACMLESAALDKACTVAQLTGLAERVLGLCQGELLPGRNDLPEVLSARDRIRSKFLRLMLSLGSKLEHAGEQNEAMLLYQCLIEQQPLAEEAYRSLIRCHLALGHRAEAFEIYRRCRHHLSVVLNLAPSSETEVLVAPLRALQAAASMRPPGPRAQGSAP
ncbi:bacterial transcriptional activator domain-containing protein [Massilia sp. NR 4-1]|uniref:AfsR/SARP family transcriptional regulator n=1 Tax=Massilia sp. NR 4-1 TaxID=1678028 RepID=UPI00067C536C|nr:bacterial transcriptional activator domain-containing protein [Massilia sp. NR 4-1]AKU23477.1 hypothetical protein ACZ75_20470 [Massilia sp. NR 4-1]